jgi:pimeloyl-ACP methyl ester carboxylesterase
MKKIKIIFLAIALAVLCINVFGQEKNNAFQVSVSGKGKQAILFIPGFACSGDVWKETQAALKGDYTFYTFTMAGFAGAPAQTSPTFKGWENVIAAYIQQNKISKPIIIGHSMGGGMALAIAADYPNLVSKIIVVDALPCLAAMMDPSFKAKENNDCSAIINKFTAIPDDQFYKMQLLTMTRLVADTGRIKQIAQWSAKSDRKTFAGMYCDFSNTDLRESIANIKCPALILLEPSFANFKPAIDEQYKNLKTAQLQYAGKGLHFIMYDDFDWYIKQLADFTK